jgi:hypothetical protein
MKPHEPDLPPLDEDLIDLLVDGELDDSQRRELLKSLDQKPDGWRRCALAFLEAQCWKQTLGRLVAEPEARRPATSEEPHSAAKPATSTAPQAAARPAPGRSPFVGRWGTALAMAASVLVALLISNYIRPGGPSSAPRGPGGIDSANLVQSPGGASSNDPWRMVTLTSNDPAGGEQSFRLPAREGKQLDAGWWQTPSPTIPQDVMKALRDSGHEVQQSRQFLPVPMQDGRKLVIPVDQVDVHYVGNPEYQ